MSSHLPIILINHKLLEFILFPKLTKTLGPLIGKDCSHFLRNHMKLYQHIPTLKWGAISTYHPITPFHPYVSLFVSFFLSSSIHILSFLPFILTCRSLSLFPQPCEELPTHANFQIGLLVLLSTLQHFTFLSTYSEVF